MRVRVAIALVLAAAATARADNEADKLFQEGRALLDAKDYAGACKKFDAALERDPKAAGTMLNLGLCHEALNHYAVALRWFHRAATQALDSGLDPEYVKAAQSHATDLSKRVTSIRIAISNPVAGMVIKIDGEELRKDELDDYAVDPGPHKLVAKAPAMKIVRKDFAITTNDPGQSIAITFEPGESGIVIDRGKTRKTIAIVTAIGGGVLVAMSGLYAGVIVKNAYDSDKKTFQGATCTSMTLTAQCQSLAQKLGTGSGSYQWNARYVGTTMFGVGLAAIGVGAALYFTAPPKERREETVFVPVLAPDQVGFAALGRF